MKTKMSQLIEKFSAERHSNNPHCDISSSQVQTINTPIPTLLFHELEAMASEYNRDVNCMAGEFLTLALHEALQNLPKKEQEHLDEVMHTHEFAEAKLQKEHCSYDAGGT